MVWNMTIIAMTTPTMATVTFDVEQPSHGHLRQLAFRDLRLRLELESSCDPDGAPPSGRGDPSGRALLLRTDLRQAGSRPFRPLIPSAHRSTARRYGYRGQVGRVTSRERGCCTPSWAVLPP